MAEPIIFGNEISHSTVFYSRQSKTCIIVSNRGDYVDDAISVAASLKPDKLFVVTPKGVSLTDVRLKVAEGVEIYEFHRT